MVSTSSVIKVRFTQEGWHRWAEAPSGKEYLKEAHRHLFHFQVECGVSHDDRQLEFHDLLAAAKKIVKIKWYVQAAADTYDFWGNSCEMIAKELAQALIASTWPITAVEVWEDGECGARVEMVS